MKEQAISFEPPIHILCHHPFVSRIIERTLALSAHPVHPFPAAQIQVEVISGKSRQTNSGAHTSQMLSERYWIVVQTLLKEMQL
jgi:hypothetical protein